MNDIYISHFSFNYNQFKRDLRIFSNTEPIVNILAFGHSFENLATIV
jgi:hypothetical protein